MSSSKQIIPKSKEQSQAGVDKFGKNQIKAAKGVVHNMKDLAREMASQLLPNGTRKYTDQVIINFISTLADVADKKRKEVEAAAAIKRHEAEATKSRGRQEAEATRDRERKEAEADAAWKRQVAEAAAWKRQVAEAAAKEQSELEARRFKLKAKKVREAEEADRRHKQALEESPAASARAEANDKVMGTVEKAGRLLSQGLLTAEEFQAIKRKAMQDMGCW